jgi:hypothetical protein
MTDRSAAGSATQISWPIFNGYGSKSRKYHGARLILNAAQRKFEVIWLPISIRASYTLIAYAGYTAILENPALKLTICVFHVCTPFICNRILRQTGGLPQTD